MPKLSILVCTLNSRKSFFNKIDKKIKRQLTPEVEYLQYCDNGEITIGAKREILKQQATGDYIVYVDDDDRISRYYVRNILEALQLKPDAVGIKGFQTTNLKEFKYFECSLIHDKWNVVQGNVVAKPVNHINPIRREIALKCPFPDLYYGEDKFYSEALKPLIKTEIMADGWLYWYDYRPDNSESVRMDIIDKNKGLKALHAAGFN
jgi:glycosyltransferase involved in cell wall biosynthesis